MTPGQTRQWPIDGRSAFQAAVLEVVQAAQRSLWMIDPSFESWALESRTGEEALRDALQRGVRVQLLVRRPGWLERHGARFMRLRQGFAHQIDCRRLPDHHRDDDSALVADDRHLVVRTAPQGVSCAGRGAFDAPLQVRQITDRYKRTWDESEACLPAVTTGL